jgi:hypothetical protein
MTNREWLNTLSNEDFAYLTPCEICAYAGKGCMEHDGNCFEGCLKWLEQEHEGEVSHEES